MILKFYFISLLLKVGASPYGSPFGSPASRPYNSVQQEIASLTTLPKLRKNVVSFQDLTQGIIDPQNFIVKEKQVDEESSHQFKIDSPRSVSDLSLDTLFHNAAILPPSKRISNFNSQMFNVKHGSTIMIDGLKYRIGEALHSKSKFIADIFALNKQYSVIITVFRTDTTDKYVKEELQQMYLNQKRYYSDRLMFSSDEDLVLIGPLYVWHEYYSSVDRNYLRSSM